MSVSLRAPLRRGANAGALCSTARSPLMSLQSRNSRSCGAANRAGEGSSGPKPGTPTFVASAMRYIDSPAAFSGRTTTKMSVHQVSRIVIVIAPLTGWAEKYVRLKCERKLPGSNGVSSLSTNAITMTSLPTCLFFSSYGELASLSKKKKKENDLRTYALGILRIGRQHRCDVVHNVVIAPLCEDALWTGEIRWKQGERRPAALR